jgi:signal transduction histidine kinase
MLRRAHRPTVRLRLTVLYAALFLIAGTLLILLTAVVYRRDLDQALAVPVSPAASTASQLADYQHRLRIDTLHSLLANSAMAWGVMAITSIALCWWVAGRALRPVQQVTATARRLSESSLHERIALTGPEDELREMAESFDAMLGRLEAAFEGQRRFVANASHELRTPLTLQRTLLEVALDDPLATAGELREAMIEAVAVSQRSERLVDSLLVLARSARGLAPQEKAEIDLASIARRAIDQEWSTHADSGLTVDSRLDPAIIVGSAALLGHLVANLVQNAIRHNRPGGWVAVVTETVGDGARLAVRNTGPVVPPDDVDRLFEPFSRMGTARTGSIRGSGLGLSIVRAVADTHGATIATDAPEDGGLSVVVDFPSVAGMVRSASRSSSLEAVAR